jgi:hypothetical protein
LFYLPVNGQYRLQLGKTFVHELILEKKISNKTKRPISIKFDADYPCVKAIQVCLDKGTDPRQRGDNHKNANIGKGHLKILFSRTNNLEKLIYMKLPETV